MSTQLQFPVRADRYCVLLTPASVRDRLADFDLDAVAVTEACRAHLLAPTFDIGLGGRELLRILPSAVTFYDQSGGARTRRIPLAELFTEALRGYGAVERLSGEQARKILNCEGGHINALVDGGELTKVAGTHRRFGPGGSDQITVVSFKDFLKRRLL